MKIYITDFSVGHSIPDITEISSEVSEMKHVDGWMDGHPLHYVLILYTVKKNNQ